MSSIIPGTAKKAGSEALLVRGGVVRHGVLVAQTSVSGAGALESGHASMGIGITLTHRKRAGSQRDHVCIHMGRRAGRHRRHEGGREGLNEPARLARPVRPGPPGRAPSGGGPPGGCQSGCQKRRGAARKISPPRSFGAIAGKSGGGEGGIRTPEGVRQLIYSQPPLAAWVPHRAHVHAYDGDGTASVSIAKTALLKQGVLRGTREPRRGLCDRLPPHALLVYTDVTGT